MDEDRVRALEDELRDLAAAEADLERDAEVAERTRIERSALTLADRLRAATAPVEVTTAGGIALTLDDNAGKTSIGGSSQIEIESSGNVSIKASGNLNLEASGVTTIKGATVQIN